ncbi:hypothetical protein LSTR_LSTR005059 [Laodelphax striatellus]|uniref:Uncharacterized protein n=1 Tax=Laodelphax striatellus TaxID=195883 RepID=A0A482WTX1_LAOST|nr:hypothetical protein LSTR_LSTR005059 [Laodelphax striatellus]
MTATADEEARRLDERIAEIRRKNEAILRRRKEIEEDKKLAEQQNAVVQLKPSIEDWPRERTPAMKPSKREMAGGDSMNSSFQDSPSPRGSGRRERPGTSSRGRDLMEKGAGPPPDPRSFLSDPDRDGGVENSRERPGRVRNESGPEFQERGGSQRDKFDQRGRGSERRSGGRGRGGGRGGGGGGGDNERGKRRDEAWRVERHKIDEARIERQKDSDGRWRREWDNEKLNFEVEGDDNKHPALTPTKTVPSKALGGRLSQWKTSVNKEVENDSHAFKRQSRGPEHVPESGFSRISALKSSPDVFRNENLEKSSSSPKYEPTPKQKVSPLASLERTILTESENFKITIKNKEPGRKEENSGSFSRDGKVRNERQPKKRAGILRTSQSSVSDEDASCPSSPAKFTQYENMTFTIRNEPVNIKRSDLEKMSHEDFVKLSQVAKPPLPSFRPPIKKETQNLVQAKTAEEDDDSWEDVNTSGTESLYESGPESPSKVSANPGVGNQSQAVPYTNFICLVPPKPSTPVTGEPVPTIIHQTPHLEIIRQIPPPTIIHQAPSQVINYQNPTSAIIHQKPPLEIIHQTQASTINYQNPPSAIIHQKPPLEIIHNNPPPTIIHQNPHPQIIHQNPPTEIIHQNTPPSIIYQNPPPSIIHQNQHPEISHQTPPPAIIYQTPPPVITHQTPPPAIIYQTPPPVISHQTPPPVITHQTPPPVITHQTPPPAIIHQPPPAASSVVDEIISESIVFVPPTTQTVTIEAPPYPYETVANIETTPNHSFNLDNYIVLVKPDTSFEEKVQLEDMNEQLQRNSHSPTVLPDSAIVSNNEEATKDAKLTEEPL